jgi:hypothetical protein
VTTTFTHEQKLRRNELADDLMRRNPGRAYVDCLGEAVEIVRGGKPQLRKKQQRKAVIDEAVRQAVKQAVASVIGEAASGTLAARPAQTAVPDTRPLHELSNDELEERVAEAIFGAPAPEPVAESDGAPGGDAGAALRDLDLTNEPLHKLDNDSFLDLLGGAIMADGQERLSSPFFAGATAPQSPFMQGLR